MIKSITFHAFRVGLDGASQRNLAVASWVRAMAGWRAAPSAARPRRVAVCEVLHDVAGTDRRFDAIEITWFDDADHLDRGRAWAGAGGSDSADGPESPDGHQGPHRAVASLVDPDRTRRLVGHEVVGRGQEWLAGRWLDGGQRLKHMAVANRADGLTPEAFSELWRSRAGTVKGSGGGTVRIPDETRGLAYVQNHVAAPCDVDAVNEVYLDDLAGLRTRVDWFAQHPPDGEDDLVGDHFFLAAREWAVLDDTMEEQR